MSDERINGQYRNPPSWYPGDDYLSTGAPGSPTSPAAEPQGVTSPFPGVASTLTIPATAEDTGMNSQQYRPGVGDSVFGSHSPYTDTGAESGHVNHFGHQDAMGGE